MVFYWANRVQYEFRIDGNSETDIDYYNSHVLSLIRIVAERTPKIYFRKKRNAIYIKFHHKKLAETFHNLLHFPYGKKNDITISSNLIGWKYLKNVLRGFFDTDGCIYFTKTMPGGSEATP